MHPTAHWLCAAACAAGLSLLAYAADPVLISPAEAADHEGDIVRLRGFVAAAYPLSWGDTKLVLAADGFGIPVFVPGTWLASRGDWLEATGHLYRDRGELRLMVDDGADVAWVASPGPEEPSWAQVTRQPEQWTNRELRLSGLQHDDFFKDGEGAALTRGDGPWLEGDQAAVTSVGHLAYLARCACYVWHATSVDAVGAG